jgi:hypothetical protein
LQPYGYAGHTPKGDRPRAATLAPSSYSAPAASNSAPAQSSSTIGYYWLQYVTCNWLLAMVLQWLAYRGSTICYLQLLTYNWILTMVHNWLSQWGYGGYTRKGREVTKSDLSNAFSHAQTRAAVQPWSTIILLVAEISDISLSTCQSSNCVSEKYQLTQGSGSVRLARCQSGGCCRLEGLDKGSSGSRFASLESITAMQFDDDVRNFTRNYTDPGATFLISLAGAKSSTEITIFPGPSVCVTSVLISDNSEMEIALIQGDFEPGQMKSVLVTPENNSFRYGDCEVVLATSGTHIRYVCVYLPKYFQVSTNDSLPPPEGKKQSFARTTSQSRAKIPTFTKQTIPTGPIFDPPSSEAWASIVTVWCWLCWRVWAVNIGGLVTQVSGRWRRRGSIIFCLVRLLSASSALLASLPAAGKRRSKFKCVPTAISAAARLTALLMLVGMHSLASAQVVSLSCNAGYFREITNAVEYNGRVYRTLDGTSPLDTSASKCQNYYLTLPSGWALADDNADSQYVIGSYRWGTQIMLVAGGRGYYTTSGSYWTSGYLSTSGSTYKVDGCNLLILISKSGSACTACRG